MLAYSSHPYRNVYKWENLLGLEEDLSTFFLLGPQKHGGTALFQSSWTTQHPLTSSVDMYMYPLNMYTNIFIFIRTPEIVDTGWFTANNYTIICAYDTRNTNNSYLLTTGGVLPTCFPTMPWILNAIQNVQC